MLEKSELLVQMNKAIDWINHYVKKTGKKGVVVGNSGGKDSATVIAMAVKALGKEKVLAVSMPCQSISRDLEDATLVADAFGISHITVDLTDTYQVLEKEITFSLRTTLAKEAKINIKPRMRMTTLYGIAQTLDYLVIGTGNLCESMVGYTTKWGDSGYDFNPIGNFTVAEVLEIGRQLQVPEKILQKAPSDGLGGCTDEDKMGVTYGQIAEMIETGNTDETAKQKILQKYQSSKHKREKAPIFTFDRKNYLLAEK